MSSSTEFTVEQIETATFVLRRALDPHLTITDVQNLLHNEPVRVANFVEKLLRDALKDAANENQPIRANGPDRADEPAAPTAAAPLEPNGEEPTGEPTESELAPPAAEPAEQLAPRPGANGETQPTARPPDFDDEQWTAPLTECVCIGESHLGYIRYNEFGVVEARDNNDVVLGVFANADAAEAALFDRWAAGAARNGGDPSTTVPEGLGLAAEEQSPPSMLAAALAYAERGWDVFPAPPGKKKSHKSAKYSNGAKWGKTRDPEQIRRDWQRWPDANVGIPTGKDNGFWVVEADTLKGHNVDGIASLRGLEEKHGPLPATLMAESPSGSLHYYFNWPEGVGISNTSSAIAPGVDVRGEGGMVIAPPSARKDGVYRRLNDNPIADAPPWLLDLVTAKGNGKSQPKEPPRIDVAEAFQHFDPGGLAAGIELPPSTPLPLEPLTKECAFIRTAFATGGKDYSQPMWNLTTLTAVFLENGHDLAHELGNQHPGYSEETTNELWERKNREHEEKGLGWPSCQAIQDAGSEHCASCLHFVKNKSPLHLALPEYEERAARRRAEQIAENIKIGDDITEPLLPQIMTLEEMRMRLVLVGSSGVVADTITGRVRKKEHAADEYAASHHTISQKNAAGKETCKTGPALKFWIASKDRLTVEVLAWVPGAGVICQPPEGPGPAFNTWRGLSPMAYPEDWQGRVKPFLEHVEFLVPIEQERERFLQWLAHIVQHPEVLPHTAYLMITPVTGTGRNLLASILVRALRGFVAAGISLPELLDGGFTGRLSKKLLAIVDEAREGSGERRYQRATRLTSMLNEEHRHVNPKYGHQSIEKNCCRWLAFSNYDDAIPFDNSDRRVIVIANPTVRKPDAYYERLYGLLNDNAFIGSVRHWLESKDTTNFRPGEHAPMNQAKLRVLNEMLSEAERAVAELKEDCATELTSRCEIKAHLIGLNNTLPVNDMHLTHAIRRAGMVNTGQRVRAYRKTGIGTTMERRFSVVIVRGNWSIEAIKKAGTEKLLEAMGLQDWSAVKPQK